MNEARSHRIEIEKVEHRGETRIALRCGYDTELIAQIKRISGRKYSRTMRCWHIPYTQIAYHELRQMPYEIIIRDPSTLGTGPADLSPDTTDISANGESRAETHSVRENDSKNHKADINGGKSPLNSISYNAQKFILAIDYHPETVAWIKSLPGAYWHKDEKKWLCNASLETLDLLQSRWSCWSTTDYDRIKGLISQSASVPTIYLSMTPDDTDRVRIQSNGISQLPQAVKSLSDRKYDKEAKAWVIPYHYQVIRRLIVQLKTDGYRVYDHTANPSKIAQQSRDWSKRKQYILDKAPASHQPQLSAYLDALMAERYSWRTIQNYTGSLIRYLRATVEQGRPYDSHDTVKGYIYEVAVSDVSFQTINRVQSALRAYFDKVEPDKKIQFDKIPGPRRPKTLPKVMSKGEIVRLLAQVKNKKHIMMLYLAYGSGLRSGEILSLKVHDIDYENQQIWIRSGKGNKDRVVPMPHSIIILLRDYVLTYQPKYWLFEGQKKNTPYSSTSLGLIFRRARAKAGLPKHYTLHSMRHSYATHLLDSGTDVRLIKELLGHKDIKTTLIYTHITDQSLNKVKSPLDELLGKTDQKHGN